MIQKYPNIKREEYNKKMRNWTYEYPLTAKVFSEEKVYPKECLELIKLGKLRRQNPIRSHITKRTEHLNSRFG